VILCQNSRVFGDVSRIQGVRSVPLAAVVCAVLLQDARSAQANGRFPAANEIVLSPTDPNLIVARATYGILPSFDHGATWTFLCEDALGLPQGSDYDPAVGLTANQSLVLGLLLPPGLEVSPDTGCNWNCAGGLLANQSITDLAVRPNAPDTVVALASTVFVDDAGGGQYTQVFQSTDDGAHFAPLGSALDPAVLVTAIEVAPSDPHRLYVCGGRGFGPTRTASLFVSIDDGATWTERVPPLDLANESAFYIGGVDPSNADLVYLRSGGIGTSGLGHSRLLVTSDAGQSFQSVLTLTGEMLGFALSPDGSTVYAGSVEDGLLSGDRTSLTFSRRSSIHVQCLAARQSANGLELWACADDASGFFVGLSTDGGSTFTSKLQRAGVERAIPCASQATGTVACGADANAAQCAGGPFQQLCGTVGCARDTKAPDCASAPIEKPAAAGLTAVAFAAALSLGRRRRRLSAHRPK
jgi:hypothetical protein